MADRPCASGNSKVIETIECFPTPGHAQDHSSPGPLCAVVAARLPSDSLVSTAGIRRAAPSAPPYTNRRERRPRIAPVDRLLWSVVAKLRKLGVDAALSLGESRRAEHWAEALEVYTKPEALPWSEIFIARRGALARHGTDRCDEGAFDEIRRLREKVERVGLQRAMRALGRASRFSASCDSVFK